jgi:seryl-tRNA synthetase
MGLDLLLFQADKDGEPELIKASQRARFKSEAIVDEIQEEYKEWTRGTFYFPPYLLTIYSQV